MSNNECEWRAATDNKSGRVYYYNIHTKATTWTKPLDLASPEERRQMIALKEQTMQFFKEMEDNIRAKIRRAEEQDIINKSRCADLELLDTSGGYYLDERTYRIEDYGNSSGTRNVRFIDDSEDSGNSVVNRARRGSSTENNFATYDGSTGGGSGVSRGRVSSFAAPRRIRTISSMDDEILLTMRKSKGSDRNTYNNSGSSSSSGGPGSNNPGRSRTYSNSSGHSNHSVDIAESKEYELGSSSSGYGSNSRMNSMRAGSKEISDRMSGRFPAVPVEVEAKYLVDNMDIMDSPSKRPRNNIQLKRRNSTGTIFVAHTMSSQNNDATIECVCIVIRTHMLDAAKENIVPLSDFDVFKDLNCTGGSDGLPAEAKCSSSPERSTSGNLSLVPSLSTVKDFFMYLFSKSQLESDCIIMALIYCERLVKETRGKLCIRYDNWRSILFACIVMASKVWDDLSMWNVDFSQVYPSFDLIRVNTLELAMLDALKYVIRVSASEYAKYYFHLRSMMTKFGLDRGEPNMIQPLDIAGAKKLQLSTEKYFEECNVSVARRRFHSVHVTTTHESIDGDVGGLNSNSNSATNTSTTATTTSTTYTLNRGVTFDGASGSTLSGSNATGNGGVSGVGSNALTASLKHSVGLEQIIHLHHMDADGNQKQLTKKHSNRDLNSALRGSNSSGTNSGSSSGKMNYSSRPLPSSGNSFRSESKGSDGYK